MENRKNKELAAMWGACAALRRNIAPHIFMNHVLAMLLHKYISDGSDGCPERFIVPQSAGFRDVFEKRHEPGNGERIDGALRRIEEANGAALQGIFRDTRFDSEEWSSLRMEKDESPRLLLELFARAECAPREIADAFLHECAADTDKISKCFYTPPAVSQLLARLVDPGSGDAIADPACGSASLLFHCAERVREKTGGAHTYTLSGQERISSIGSLARMNLFLHGECAQALECGDTLSTPLLLDENGGLRHFDVVVANPPFSLPQWGYETAESDAHKRFARGVPPRNRSEYAFILHMLAMLRPDSGRMAVVMPHGVLFRGGTEAAIREKLVEENLLDAVIGLPGKILYDTTLPVVILVFRKQKQDDTVLFIDASKEFQRGKNQNMLGRNEIAKIAETYASRKNVKNYASSATKQEIRDNKYNLSIPKYIDISDTGEESDLRTLLLEKAQLANEMQALERELDSHLTDFGINIRERRDHAQNQKKSMAEQPENRQRAEIWFLATMSKKQSSMP